MIYPLPYLLIIFIYQRSARGLGIPTKMIQNKGKHAKEGTSN